MCRKFEGSLQAWVRLMTALSQAAAVGPSVHLWAGATTADTDLTAHRLPYVAAALDCAIDRQRLPAAVDWAMDRGLHQGHVLILYKLARNQLKWAAVGRVPATVDMGMGLFLALALLLRVAQDVQACVTDLARPARAWVYDAFCDKVAGWVAGWRPEALPELEPITAQVLAWASNPDAAWPNPAWAAAFALPTFVGAAFTFAEPAPVDVAALERCRTLSATRTDVALRLQGALHGVTVWDGTLVRRLKGIVIVTPAPSSAQASAEAT